MAHLRKAAGLAFLLLLAQPAMAEDKPCAGTSSVSDVRLTLAIKDHAAVFQLGEIIPLELSFTATTKDRYWADDRNYDRSGRLTIEEYCVEPEAPDPLATYFQRGFFMGGGLGGVHPLDAAPFHAEADLNEWHTLAPGHYRLYAVSHRVWRVAEDGGRAEVVVGSNTIDLDVNPPDPAWQSEQLRRAAETFAHPASPAETRDAARILRFLNTRESAKEIASVMGRNDQSDLYFGLVASPYGQTVIDALHTQLAVPDRATTDSFLNALVDLRLNADATLPPQDPKQARAYWDQRQKRREELMRSEIHAAVTALPAKSGTSRALTLETLLTMSGSEPGLAQTIRPALIAAWPDLPPASRERLLQSQWARIAGPDMVPLLRKMLAEGPRQVFSETALLQRLYELDRAAGRQAILKDVMNGNEVSPDVMKLLSKEEVDIALPLALDRIGRNGARPIDYELVDLYADESALPVVKTALEAILGKWVCVPQSAMLRYVLRVAPEYGARQVSAALAVRKNAGCYHDLLTDLGARLPSVQPIAIAALDDPDPDVVRSAATALSRWGSKEAEGPLWARLQKFHSDWAERSAELVSKPNFQDAGSRGVALEQELVSAIATGSAWICPPEKLLRLQDLVWTRNERQQIDGWIRQWHQPITVIGGMWAQEDKPAFSVFQYGNLSEEQFGQKMAQLPPGTTLEWQFSIGVNRERQEAAFERVRAAAASHGIVVDRAKL